MSFVKSARVVVVTSGKGGVGKTTTSASFATGLAIKGHKTIVIDFDIGLRNLDLVMGCERRVVFDIVGVISGEASIKQAIIKDKHIDDLYILAASQTKDKDALDLEGVGNIIKDLAAMGFKYIICDSPAGIEKGAMTAMYYADTALIVTNPEISSVRDSDRVLGLLSSKTLKAKLGEVVEEHLVITRYSARRVSSGDMLGLEDIQDLLGIATLGIIPESQDVLNASNRGIPVIKNTKSDAGAEYMKLVSRFLKEPLEDNKSAFKKFMQRFMKKQPADALL